MDNIISVLNKLIAAAGLDEPSFGGDEKSKQLNIYPYDDDHRTQLCDIVNKFANKTGWTINVTTPTGILKAEAFDARQEALDSHHLHGGPALDKESAEKVTSNVPETDCK